MKKAISILVTTLIFCSCSEDDSPETVTDFDGNVYKTVAIGSQVWMAENLKTTSLNDGTAIPIVTDQTEWSNLWALGINTPAYCWYNNDESNADLYGGLYNGYAVYTEKICPVGWHVPSDEEWTVLTDFLGGLDLAGIKLKSKSGWDEPDYNPGDGGNGNNKSGFNGLPSGSRANYEAGFFNVGKSTAFWSSTIEGPTVPWIRTLSNSDGEVGRLGTSEGCGLCIRCIKD